MTDTCNILENQKDIHLKETLGKDTWLNKDIKRKYEKNRRYIIKRKKEAEQDYKY